MPATQLPRSKVIQQIFLGDQTLQMIFLIYHQSIAQTDLSEKVKNEIDWVMLEDSKASDIKAVL